MMRIAGLVAVVWVMLLGASAVSDAGEKRVALVIGNAAYDRPGVPRLDVAVSDARAIGDLLTTLRFDVVAGYDLDLNGLVKAIGQFADRVGDADVALVYFAGHGATFLDTSYVVPVDAQFSSVTEVARELVPVETLIGDLRKAKGVRIAIIDACRDNGAEQELKRRASRGGDETRGLAAMTNTSDLIIAYAAQYGETASDDAGPAPPVPVSARHSPFTAALLNNIPRPGVAVSEMLRGVGRDVTASTRGRQLPEISAATNDAYVLVPEANPGEAGGVRPHRPPADEFAWSLLQDTTDAGLLRRFIDQYPASPRRRDAQERLAGLERLPPGRPP